jgi:putative copper export protein
MIETILRDLQRPEYLHVLINPLPVYGLAIALLGLIAAMYLRNRGGQVTALVLVFVCAASAWPVAHYGEAAEDGVLAMADEDGQAWLKAHAHRGDNFIYVFYVLALVSAAAIFAPAKWPRTARPLAIATLILAIASLGTGSYIAHAGGKIRHREFRTAPPPKTE